MEEYSRTINLIGIDKVELLQEKCVLIAGLGGVGGYTVEMLARCGVGKLILIDSDLVDITNINRQIIATHSTVGKLKTDVFKERINDINPQIKVITYNTFILPDSINEIDFSNTDYIIDCVDTVSAKIALIEKAKELNIPVISSMGTGNKLDPTRFKIADISKTNTCPLARVMRLELKKKNISDVKVLYSDELPVKTDTNVPATISFVPSVAGILIARQVIIDLIK